MGTSSWPRRLLLRDGPYQADLERNYKWVAEARRQGDTVVVGLLQQGASRSEREPPDHTRIFAHGAIDAGADVFVVRTGGAASAASRSYKGKVILYGLPGFVRQRASSQSSPNRWRRFALTYEAAAGEFLERRDEDAQGHTMPPSAAPRSTSRGGPGRRSPSGRGCKTPRRLPFPKPADAVLPPQRSFAKASGGRGGKKGGRRACARAPSGACPLSVSPSGGFAQPG